MKTQLNHDWLWLSRSSYSIKRVICNQASAIQFLLHLILVLGADVRSVKGRCGIDNAQVVVEGEEEYKEEKPNT